jgi:HPr kinase/phosphorylase
MAEKEKTPGPQISVEDLVKLAPLELALEVLSPGNDRQNGPISSDRVQKLGLAFTGFTDYLKKGRLKVIGKSEISYLASLDRPSQVQALERLDPGSLTCVLITQGLSESDLLAAFAKRNELPVLRTPLVSSRAIGLVTTMLREELAPHATIHAVLMEIHGVGVLILGDSGIGKSECALDLISRGHALISDDSVLIKRIGNRLIGDSVELTRGHIEIRGLGIVNARDLFGSASVGGKLSIELSIELKAWDEVSDPDRLGLDIEGRDVFGVTVPSFVLPVSPARNLATLAETAVRIFLAKRSGVDSVRELVRKHSATVMSRSN